MGDNATAQPPAKKRGATRQISKDDGSDSEDDRFPPSESTSFQKASDEVIASRRIVKVRRSTPAPAAPTAPNPFASIRLVSSTVLSGLPPTSLVSVASEAPFQEPLDAAVTGKDGVAVDTETGVKDVGYRDVIQEGEADKKDNRIEEGLTSKVGEKKAEIVERNVEGTEDVVEQHSVENGKGDDIVLKPLDIESEDHKTVDASKDSVLGQGGSEKSELNLPACAVITDKGLGLAANDKEGLNDEEDTENAEVNGPGLSVQGDEEPISLPTGASTDKVSPLPSLAAVIPGTFTFGTAPSSFETPTAFASFSSTWSAFSSGTGSGASLGSGFAFSKVASEGTFASASSTFGNSNGSSFQLFSNSSSGNSLSAGPPAQPPASAIHFQGGNTQTGEEQEKMVFGGDATLFEFVDGSWKERGKGELRVNVPLDKTGKARLLMRSKGNYRLILNAGLFPDMKMTSMDSRGVTFACVNSAVEEKSGLVTYAVKFKDSLAAGGFRDAVEAHKCPSQGVLKTPENSPSAHYEP